MPRATTRQRSREPTVQSEGFCFCCASRPSKPKKKHVTLKPETPPDSDASPRLDIQGASSSSASPARPPVSFEEPSAATAAPAPAAESEAEEEESEEEVLEVPCSCGAMMRADAIFCRACGKKRLVMTSQPGRDLERDIALLQELETLANKMKGPMQKFPKKGKKMFSLGGGPQERYFVVQQDDTPAEAGMPRATEFQRWRSGTLGYWESQSAFKGNDAPKGRVELMQITKVQHQPLEERGRGIVIKHRDGTAKVELVLLASSEAAAKEWSYQLWDFIAKLRSH